MIYIFNSVTSFCKTFAISLFKNVVGKMFSQLILNAMKNQLLKIKVVTLQINLCNGRIVSQCSPPSALLCEC